MGYHDHICGCYILVPTNWSASRKYLPQARIKAHTTVLSSVARTSLIQSYENPTAESLPEVRYTFPLFDGVSVVSYEVKVGSRIIKGLVKQKDEAKKTFKEAVNRGETAGLLEQLPDAADVFTSTIGNVPAKSTVEVEISYVAELKHDFEVDGIRVTIPTSIAPRYGHMPGELLNAPHNKATGANIDITVDILMDEGRPISKILSPSHPISVSIGTLSTDPDAVPAITRGSATLAMGNAGFDKDFVLQIVAKDVGIPRALLETHPTLPDHRALTATLVPKFKLKSIRPEIVIVADRSGSMGGSSMKTLVAALQVLLKSFPPGVRFNICSFGSDYEFLWPQSQAYNQANLDTALDLVSHMDADFGGTETQSALKAAIDNRQKSLPTEILLMTDGDIWQQQECFDYVRGEVRNSDGAIRVFPIGIGNGVSSALIEGLARAGNGVAQQIQSGERLDTKAVRMLKAALTPHITDYSLEVNYVEERVDATKASEEHNDDDFELVEKVSDCLTLAGSDGSDNASENADQNRKPISLYDKDDNKDMEEEDENTDRYSHLPTITTPKLLQAPHQIPPLFPFSRTSVYLLMSSQAAHLRPASVTLRGTAPEGPLELQIPIETLLTPGTTIHQLAAKKAIQELEEADGWLDEAKASNGELIKEVYAARFDEIREREAVRLGVEHQVGGKWCSFVAVEANIEGEQQEPILQESVDPESPPAYSLSRGRPATGDSRTLSARAFRQRAINPAPASSFGGVAPPGGGAFLSCATTASGGAPRTGGGQALFGRAGAAPPPPPGAPMALSASANKSGGAGMKGLLKHFKKKESSNSTSDTSKDEITECLSGSSSLPQGEAQWDLDTASLGSQDYDGFMQTILADASAAPASFDDCEEMRDSSVAREAQVAASPDVSKKSKATSSKPTSKSTPSSSSPPAILNNSSAHKSDPHALTLALIALSRTLGGWDASVLSYPALRIPRSSNSLAEINKLVQGLKAGEDMVATAVVVEILKMVLGEEEEVWELVVEKAVGWLDESMEENEKGLNTEGLISNATKVVVEAFGI